MTMTKRILLITMFALLNAAMPALVCGQSENQRAAEKVSLCDLAQHPKQYNGKMVEVRASITGQDLSIDDFEQKPACSSWMGVLLVLPDQVSPKPAFDVIRDDAFNRLFEALHSGMNIQATFRGQFEAAYTWTNHKQVWISDGLKGRKGFGKKGQYGGRIVLQSLTEVVARPVPRK
jgi:hypothetical protein